MCVRMMSDEWVLKAFDDARQRAFIELEQEPTQRTKDVVERIRELMKDYIKGYAR